MNEISSNVLNEIITNAAKAWVFEDESRFYYGEGPIVYNDKAKYNLMRNIGIRWVQNEILKLEPELNDNAKFSSELFLQSALRDDLMNNFSYFEEHKFTKSKTLIGAQGLFLLAYPNADVCEGVIEFILKSQLPTGDFIHKFDSRLYPTAFRSNYYTGEVLFGMARWLRVSKSDNVNLKERTVIAITRALNFLFPNYGVKSYSHWMFYALTEIHLLMHEKSHVLHDDVSCMAK